MNTLLSSTFQNHLENRLFEPNLKFENLEIRPEDIPKLGISTKIIENLKKIPKSSILPNVIESSTTSVVSAALGCVETEIVHLYMSGQRLYYPLLNIPFQGTNDPVYQALLIAGFWGLSILNNIATHYAYRRITKRPSHLGIVDIVSSYALSMLIFNTSAWLTGLMKGWDSKYLGWPDLNYETVKGPAKELFHMIKFGSLEVPISYLHGTGLVLGPGLKFISNLHRARPLKSVNKLKEYGHRTKDYLGSYNSKFLEKSKIPEFGVKGLSLMVKTFGLMVPAIYATGHPLMGTALATVPVAYGIKDEAGYYATQIPYYAKEYGTYAIEIAKAKAESLVYRFKRLLS